MGLDVEVSRAPARRGVSKHHADGRIVAVRMEYGGYLTAQAEVLTSLV